MLQKSAKMWESVRKSNARVSKREITTEFHHAECTRTHFAVQWIRKNRWTVKRHFYTFAARVTTIVCAAQLRFVAIYIVKICELNEEHVWKDWILIELRQDLNEQSRSRHESENFIAMCALRIRRLNSVRCWSSHSHEISSGLLNFGIFLHNFPIEHRAFSRRTRFASLQSQMDRNQSPAHPCDLFL